jgi:Zn-dependent protease
MDHLMVGVMWYVIFLFATTLHETAHAWAALRLGDATAYRGGQVSLEPWPHIRREPVGMVLLPVVSFLATGWPLGWASAPYERDWADRWPRRAALMALAGPTANLLLVVVGSASSPRRPGCR